MKRQVLKRLQSHSGLVAHNNRLAFMDFLPPSCLSRLTARRRSSARFCAALRSRVRHASSPKVTSSTQCSEFSMAQRFTALCRFRQELTQARQDQAAVSLSRGVPGDSATPSSKPAQKEPLIHLMPEALAMLQPHAIDPSTLTHSTCCVDGVWLQNNLARDDVTAGPDWEPSQPAPLSSQEAEWKARQEIRRLFRDGDRWVANGASLHDDHGSRKWYYSIGFQSPDKKAHFSVFVSMSGAIGTTTLGRNIHEEIPRTVPAPGQ